MDSARPEEWYLAWMSGPARLQIDNRKREAAELCSALSPSSDLSYDAQTLQDLLQILNHEFLCHKLSLVKEACPDTCLFDSDDFPVALSKEWATDLLGILSSCLVKSPSATAYRERELQCRALVATTALILAQKTEALQNDFSDGFHQSLSRRFDDLKWQHGPSGDLTHVKFCKVQCSYLLAAAEEFSSRFRRAQPLFLTVSSRIISLLTLGFSVASPAYGGGSFNLQATLTQLSEDLGEISRQPDWQYEAIFNLQELSMLVNALQVYQGVVKQFPAKSELAKATLECTQRIGNITIQTLEYIISDNNNYENIVIPPAAFWDETAIAPLQRGPPSFDMYYFLYGVIDFGTQIGKIFDKPFLAPELDSLLRQVVLTGNEATHRWKALEYLISVESKNPFLLGDLVSHVTSEGKLRLQHEFEYVSAAVKGEVASYPLPTLAPSSSGKKRHRTIISPASCMEKIQFGSMKPKIDTTCEQISIRASDFPVKNVLSAGFSPDCKAAFAQTSEKAVVISLSNIWSREEQTVLAKQQTKGVELIDAALSNKYLATISNKELRVIAYRHSSSSLGDMVGSGALGKSSDNSIWVPYSVAIHDMRRRTWIAVAGETALNGLACGTIKIYEVYGSGTMGVLKRHRKAFTQASRDVLRGCSIQSVGFSPNGARLVCITNDNRVLIWLLSNNVRPRNAPFVLVQKFTEGPGFAGVTSAAVFQGPSSKSYILGTTWPSIERHRNGGEWSFVSPIASSPAEVPSKIFHKLKDLGDAGPILGGAVSARGEMIALWEESGQIVVLPLEASEDGGLKAQELIKLEVKKKSLWKLSRTSPSSMRFQYTEDGLVLFVLGRSGAILYKRFDHFGSKARRHSPRPSVVAEHADNDDYANSLSLRLRASNSDESRSEYASGLNIGDGHDQSDLALLSETLRKTSALSFTEEVSVTAALVLTRSQCPNESLWRRTLMRKNQNTGDQVIEDHSRAFQTYLSVAQELEQEMAEYTFCGEIFQVDENSDSVRSSRAPDTPSMDSHSSSVREIYKWLSYLQDVHSRTMAGVQLLYDDKLLDGFLNAIVKSDNESNVANLIPISLELLEVMMETIVKGLDILRPHLDDSREMGLMEMFDALYPLKRLLDSMSRGFGLFSHALHCEDDEDADADTGLPAAEDLERFRLLTEMIFLSVLSYPGSHATDFPQRHLDADCKEFRLFTKEWVVHFRQYNIGCVREFVQRLLWVFAFDRKASAAATEPSATQARTDDLYLSTTIWEFADLWGRVSLIFPVKGRPQVTGIDWPGGILRAASNGSDEKDSSVGNEVLCHTVPWTAERPEASIVPFDSRKRILIHPSRP